MTHSPKEVVLHGSHLSQTVQRDDWRAVPSKLMSIISVENKVISSSPFSQNMFNHYSKQAWVGRVLQAPVYSPRPPHLVWNREEQAGGWLDSAHPDTKAMSWFRLFPSLHVFSTIPKMLPGMTPGGEPALGFWGFISRVSSSETTWVASLLLKRHSFVKTLPLCVSPLIFTLRFTCWAKRSGWEISPQSYGCRHRAGPVQVSLQSSPLVLSEEKWVRRCSLNLLGLWL